MAKQCRYLEYRVEAGGKEFETARAFCTVDDRFVQPMRADICNRRYDLEPERDCEIFERAQASDEPETGGELDR